MKLIMPNRLKMEVYKKFNYWYLVHEEWFNNMNPIARINTISILNASRKDLSKRGITIVSIRGRGKHVMVTYKSRTKRGIYDLMCGEFFSQSNFSKLTLLDIVSNGTIETIEPDEIEPIIARRSKNETKRN